MKIPVDFWSYAKERSPRGCWLWTGSLWRGGYGQYVLEGKPNSAHRLAFLSKGGRIPHGKVVRHTCDVRRCVNPEHLILGTQRENMLDMYERGRARGAGGEKRALNTWSKSLSCSFYLSREDKEKIVRLAALWAMSLSQAVSLLIQTVGDHKPGGPGGSLKVIKLR